MLKYIYWNMYKNTYLFILISYYIFHKLVGDYLQIMNKKNSESSQDINRYRSQSRVNIYVLLHNFGVQFNFYISKELVFIRV